MNLAEYLVEAEVSLTHYLEAHEQTSSRNELKWEEKKADDLRIRSSIIDEIEAAWSADSSLTALVKLPESVLQKAARLAAEVIGNFSNLEVPNDFVDSVSGLPLPPPGLKKPYRERGHHDNGKRLTIFEHLQREYGEYIAAGVLFSGHLFEIDRPAYEALLYASEKEAKERHLKKGENTADFAFRHGILTNEHLAAAPKGFERQAELLRTLRTTKKAAGMTNAAAEKLNKMRSGRGS